MGGASDWTEIATLNYLLRRQTLYVALYSNDPTDADTGKEISTENTGYKRKEVIFGEPKAEGGRTLVSNNAKISFPRALSDWGDSITHWGIRDAEEEGNLIVYGGFTKKKDIEEGELFSIESGAIKVEVE